MGDSILVRTDDAEFYVEVADGGGPQTASYTGTFSFADVESTIHAIGSSVVRAFNAIKPSEASVEFNLSLTAKSGKLTGLLVEGEAESSLKITLTWNAPG